MDRLCGGGSKISVCGDLFKKNAPSFLFHCVSMFGRIANRIANVSCVRRKRRRAINAVAVALCRCCDIVPEIKFRNALRINIAPHLQGVKQN